MTTDLLLQRLHAAGIDDILAIAPSAEGMAAVAGIATRRAGGQVFVKTFATPQGDDLFAREAEGLRALRQLGGVATPEVVHAGRDALVLSALQPRPATEAFWERTAHTLAQLHMGTISQRYGWHHDNWLGSKPQRNGWDDDGFRFFAEKRVLRWLEEPRVQAKLAADERRALERLCQRLPELLPPQPACLTHGDCWAQNILATADGEPALIDPAVSYMWADVDLSHLWCSPHPAEARRLFDVYGQLTGREPGWLDRLPLIHLRQHMALMAMYDHDWGSTEAVRALVAPFRTR
ncbi:fructosamine kinase family protein [Chloroflexia bacterium SDU3-3]|nr:fructosamine kinase family protein [Chloroflexia bacterium SDU3-3]